MPGPGWRTVKDYAGMRVAGIDEVGRGAWAGPVVAAAVVLPYGLHIKGLNDSKLLSALERQQHDRAIRRMALAIGIGWVSASEVDANGLTWAVRASGLRALEQLGFEPDCIILDGKHNYLSERAHCQTLVKADSKVVPVAAASVVAKVARDRYVQMLERHYPGYGLSSHKGYGTRAHRLALGELGASPFHRHSYAPLRALG